MCYTIHMERLIKKLKAISYYDQFNTIPLWILQKEVHIMKQILKLL